MREAYDARVSEFMSRAVISLGKDVEVRRAADVLIERNISGVMVVDGEGRPIGVFSALDVVAAIREGRVSARIQDFMSAEVYAVSPNATLREAARLMSDMNIHRLFVYPGRDGVVAVSGEDAPLGIVTSRDVMRALAGAV